MEPLFPALPDDLSGLSDDDLASAIDTRVATAQRVHDGDAELIGDMAADVVLDAMRTGVEQIEALRAEQTARDEARDQARETLAELAARVGLTVETDDDEGKEPAVEEPEAVVASTQPARRAATLVRSPRHEPKQPDPEQRTVITAAADLPGVPMGASLDGPLDLARAMLRRKESIGRLDVGNMEKVLVASVTRRYDEDETLRPGDTDGNWAKIQSKVSRTALAASGGLCAPRTPYYDLMQIAVADRPVRDSLPRFNADRGGIRFVTPPSLADVTDAIGIITAAEDASGGSSAIKSCQAVTCPQVNEVDVDILFHCLRFGNLGARTFPEQVSQFVELTAAAWSRMADTNLLDGIALASTAVTASALGGANASLLGEILTAAAGMRSRHRMNPEATLRLVLPAWTLDLLIADLIRAQFDRKWGNDDGGVTAFLRTFGVEPTWTIDGPTGGSQVFGTQGAGALIDFPTHVVWYLFPEGSFLWLDGGSLELGIVRDSVLNSTNDFTIFGESFEGLAYVGVESLQVTSAVCASGRFNGGHDLGCPSY